MSLQVTILTPDRRIFDRQECHEVELPGRDGTFGILENHTPLLAPLGIGVIRLRSGGEVTHRVAVAEGMVEVSEDHVLVTAHAAERSDEIDVARAKAARKRAEDRLHHRRDVDVERAQAALARALNRIRIAEAKLH
ncbi:MAG: F0F1 ATP synthase subunit epsilon [Planctomycetes bacterium]|nr:F0F1 ATP synthase subunit epsilon [Planctomycetota bacterium]